MIRPLLPLFNSLIFRGAENGERLERAVHANKGLFIMAVEPVSLAVLKSPGEWGADIAVGEGQPLGCLAWEDPIWGSLLLAGN